MRRLLGTVAVLAMLATAIPAAADSTELENPIEQTIRRNGAGVSLSVLAEGLTAPVWGTSAPGHPDHLYVVDQEGELWAIDVGSGASAIVLDVKDRLVDLGAFGPGTFDERGFLGAAFSPYFADDGLLYTYTSEPGSGPADFSTMPDGEEANHQTVITEWSSADPTDPYAGFGDPRVLLTIDQPMFNHNGGAIDFDTSGQLLIAVGDGGGADDEGVGHGDIGNGQDASNPLGAILRIDPDGTNSANGEYGIPADNPFVGDDGVLDEIFAYGFRNPYRLSVDDESGYIFAGDVGQNDIEELDIVVAGGNYGWRLKEGSFFFEPNGDGPGFVTDVDPGVPAGLIDPIAEYDHDDGVSIIGGFVYRGNTIAGLQGRYVFGEFSPTFSNDGRLFQIGPDGSIMELRMPGGAELGFSLLGFGQDAAGEIYVLVNTTFTPFGDTGVVLKLGPVR